MPNSTAVYPAREAPASESKLFFTPWRLACLGLLLLAALVYLPAIKGLFLWDDSELVSGKGIGGGDSLLHCFTKPFLNYYFRPLVSVSFYLDNLYSDHNANNLPNPFFYHQTNILLHVLTVGLLIGLLGAAFPGRRAIAFLGGLLFAVQPSQVGAVAMIGGRTDALCTFFVIGFAWALVAAARSEGGRRAVLTGLSALLFGCALLSKEQALALLPLAPLAFVCFRPEGRPNRLADGLKATLPFLAVIVAFLVAWKTLSGYHIMKSDNMPLHMVGVTTIYYAMLLFAPAPCWMFSICLTRFVDHEWLWAVPGFAVIALTVVLFIRWMRREPAAAWLLAMIALPIAPVSNILPIPSLVIASYRVGMCGPAVAALLGWAIDSIGNRLQSKPASGRATGLIWRVTAGGALAIWYAGLTLWGASRMTSGLTLFYTLEDCDPYSITAHETMGNYYLSVPPLRPAAGLAALESLMDRLYESSAWRTQDGALRAFRDDPRIALRVNEHKSDRKGSRSELSLLCTKIGIARLKNNDVPGAYVAFLTAVSFQPRRLTSNVGVAECAFLLGHLDETRMWARKALAIYPNSARSYLLLGKTYIQQKRWQEALPPLEHCLSLEPDSRNATLLLAEAQAETGDIANAEGTQGRALNLPADTGDLELGKGPWQMHP